MSIPSLDLTILRALYAGGCSPLWVDALRCVTFLGSGWMLLALLPAFLLPRWRMEAVAVLVTLTITSAAVASVKALVGRVRPCQALPWAHTLAIEVPVDFSFPSGHAAGSFAFASLVFAFYRRAGVMLFGLAAVIGLTRVMLGVHYPSDVAAGALLGSALGLGGARIYRVRRAPVTSAA